MFHPDRRSLLAGLAAASLPLATAKAASAKSPGAYLAYEARLRAAVRDVPGRWMLQMAAEILSATNALRRANGASPLADEPELLIAAQAQAADMAVRGFFAHESPEGMDPSTRAGLLVRRLSGLTGENLAKVGMAPFRVRGRDFFEMWLESEGHRRNMLRPDYTHAAHAFLRVGDNAYGVAVFGGIGQRLPRPFPLRPDRASLSALGPDVMVSPAVRDERARLIPASADRSLPPGAWRLRPMLRNGPERGPIRHYDVLWGPIFVV